MLKIVVFDCGMGGELLADYLEKELPIVEIIRVIDWHHADAITKSRYAARRFAENALRPYLGHVDLIVFANHLLSLTSLNYFRRKYPDQPFIGLKLIQPTTFKPRPALILTTSAITRTFGFHRFLYRLRRPTTILTLDDWPQLIDAGELTTENIKLALRDFLPGANLAPAEIILAHSHFNDIRPTLRRFYFRQDIQIYDSFAECFRQICRLLHLRGALHKKK